MFLLLTLNISHLFFSVSVVDCEQVNVSWVVSTPPLDKGSVVFQKMSM